MNTFVTCMKKTMYLWILVLFGIIMTPFTVHAETVEYTDLTQDAVYDAGSNTYTHNYGDGILVEDYTLPENCLFNWYNSNLTIASGVTLTIPEGSVMFMAGGSDADDFPVILIEEGAVVRILGDIELNEYNVFQERFSACLYNVILNGTIESEAQGIDGSRSIFELNGNINSYGPAVYIEQSVVKFNEGEYFTENGDIVQNKYIDYGNVVQVYGGLFSRKPGNVFLGDGVELVRLEGGKTEAVKKEIVQEAEESLDDLGFTDRIKTLIAKEVKDIKDVWGKAKSEKGNVLAALKDPRIIVLLIFILALFVNIGYDLKVFIGASGKEKKRILFKTIICIGIIIGGVYVISILPNSGSGNEKDPMQMVYADKKEISKKKISTLGSSMQGIEAYEPGVYLVGEDIEPGLYYFEAEFPTEAINPFTIHFSKTEDFNEIRVGAWTGRTFVELEKGYYIRVIGAYFLKAGEQAAYVADQDAYRQGTYQVGRDIAPGIYTLEVASVPEKVELRISDTICKADNVWWVNYDEGLIGQDHIGKNITLKEGQYLTVMPDRMIKLIKN